jgi:hypothetical protein
MNTNNVCAPCRVCQLIVVQPCRLQLPYHTYVYVAVRLWRPLGFETPEVRRVLHVPRQPLRLNNAINIIRKALMLPAASSFRMC